MVTHLAFIIRNGEKQKTPALNNKERGKAKSTHSAAAVDAVAVLAAAAAPHVAAAASAA